MEQSSNIDWDSNLGDHSYAMQISVSTAPNDEYFQNPQLASTPLEELQKVAFTSKELTLKKRQQKTNRKFIPQENKDAKYYEARRKNAAAVQRCRIAKEDKEKRMIIRLKYLEKEYTTMKGLIQQYEKERMENRKKLQSWDEFKACLFAEKLPQVQSDDFFAKKPPRIQSADQNNVKMGNSNFSAQPIQGQQVQYYYEEAPISPLPHKTDL